MRVTVSLRSSSTADTVAARSSSSLLSSTSTPVGVSPRASSTIKCSWINAQSMCEVGSQDSRARSLTHPARSVSSCAHTRSVRETDPGHALRVSPSAPRVARSLISRTVAPQWWASTAWEASWKHSSSQAVSRSGAGVRHCS